MPNWISEWWAKWIFGLVGGGLVALGSAIATKIKKRSTAAEISTLKDQVKTIEDQQNALVTALRASMYDRLYYLHRTFMKQGWISIPDLENATGIYEGYHGLEGNGVGTKLYEDLCRLPNFEPM